MSTILTILLIAAALIIGYYFAWRKFSIQSELHGIKDIDNQHQADLKYIALQQQMEKMSILDAQKAKDDADKKAHLAVEKQRHILKGKISEQLAPFIEGGFPEGLLPSEAHFLGNPVDFIVFKGINEKKITEVVFVELKTGKSYMNGTEYSLQETINNKRVRFISHKIPETNLNITNDTMAPVV